MTLINIGTTMLTGVIFGMIYSVYALYARHVERQRFMQASGCQKAYRYYPFKEPFLGLDMMYNTMKAARGKKLLGFFQGLFDKYSNTFVVKSLLGPTVIMTADAENAKAVYTTKFADWSVAPAREALKPALGGSIIMTDGPAWSHMRGSMRPIFARDNVANLDLLERHFQALVSRVPSDGSTVDLQPLFHSLTLDVTTEFAFGHSMHTLSSSESDPEAQLHRNFELVMEDVVNRARFGRLYPFFKDKRASAAVENIKSKAESYSREALESVANASHDKEADSGTDAKKNYSFLGELAKSSGDVEKMRDEALTLLFGGRDTTATLLSLFWYLLARHPAVWKELLAEVDQLEGGLPTYEWLKQARYLRYCEHEAMRLFPSIPLFPPRVANKDTFIPLGGGADGKSPLFVPKGSKFLFNQWALNHREDIWGEDAEEFRPSRWETARPGWNYIPFGGGPRICIGQEFALTEMYYMTVRLMQTFRRIESRDSGPWVEKFSTTINSQSGVLVGLHAQ